jgi:hypothetical protein
MSTGMEAFSKLTVVAQADAEEVQQNLFVPPVRAAVRYADPFAWLAATALARALAHVNNWTPHVQHATGLIAVSEQAPADAICAIAQAATEGFSSPLRYPAANPGSFAGVSCIAHGLRGPTMNLTMPPHLGVPVALRLANSWLIRQGLLMAAVTTCGQIESGKNFARCLLLTARKNDDLEPLTATHLDWLAVEHISANCFQGSTCSQTN